MARKTRMVEYTVTNCTKDHIFGKVTLRVGAVLHNSELGMEFKINDPAYFGSRAVTVVGVVRDIKFKEVLPDQFSDKATVVAYYVKQARRVWRVNAEDVTSFINRRAIDDERKNAGECCAVGN